jgi:hypothetical protein
MAVKHLVRIADSGHYTYSSSPVAQKTRLYARKIVHAAGLIQMQRMDLVDDADDALGDGSFKTLWCKID